MREFQIYGDCMLPTIPVIFEINTLCGLLISTLNYDFFFEFPYIFCGVFRLPVIPVKFICILRGTPCITGILYTFYRGKICSVVPKSAQSAQLKKLTVSMLQKLSRVFLVCLSINFLMVFS